MNQEVKQERKTAGESGQTAVSKNHCCPRCGDEMTATTKGVAASYPSPALERLVCSDSGCDYVKYVKLDSNGFPPKGNQVSDRGEQSA